MRTLQFRNPALTILLPKSWPAKVRSAMLHVVSLAKYAAVYTRSWAADCPKARVRVECTQEDNALLREGIRIKDARMASIPPIIAPSTVARRSRDWSLVACFAA